MPEEITINGLEEHAFRRSIETMLRNGRADQAADELRALLPAYAGDDKVLPARLLEITVDQLKFTGWDQIATKIDEYGRTESPITAVGIGIGDPEDMGIYPDANGHLTPPLETSFFSDATYPFSETDRDDLLEGYSSYGCEWQGDYDKADKTLAIEGIDDLYGAIAALENQVSTSAQPSAQDICAGAVGACYLGVLVFQAARDAAVKQGLPRPLVVLLVNSDAYPFFDAPVMTCDEYLNAGEVKVVEAVTSVTASGDGDDFDSEEAEESASLISMVSTGRADGKKKMALALEGDEAANPLGMADELIAQAAFAPDSVDASQFMPRDIFAAAEPLSGVGDEPPATHGGETDHADHEEIKFPAEATLTPGTESDFAADLPAAGLGAGETQNPDLDAPHSAQGHAPQPGFEEAQDGQHLDPAYDWAETAPDGGGDDTGAIWPSSAESADAVSADAPIASWQSTASDSESVRMPWHDQGSASPFSPTLQQQPRASHSIRERIRVAQPEPQGPSVVVRYITAVARFIKRVQEFLLRR
ncbi:MAG: hypothetical protein KUG65_12900 [Sphingomonadaceae bacterium]|nr:hypothetical protein [Sphingomonadaceae bacterium]